MTSTRAALGDSHNFGRRVSLREGRVHKPRTLAWERLVLSGESPLRRLLDDAAERDGLGRDAFGFLPSLEFFPARAPEEGGEVERVELAPLPALGAAERRTLARSWAARSRCGAGSASPTCTGRTWCSASIAAA